MSSLDLILSPIVRIGFFSETRSLIELKPNGEIKTNYKGDLIPYEGYRVCEFIMSSLGFPLIETLCNENYSDAYLIQNSCENNFKTIVLYKRKK